MNGPEDQPFDDLTCFDLKRETMRKLPEKICREKHVVLLEDPQAAGRRVVALGMLDVSDDRAARAAENRICTPVRRVQLNAFELERALEIGFGAGEAGPGVGPGKVGPLRLSHANRIGFRRAQAAEMMVMDTLSEAVRRRASDVHIETYQDDVDVRFRIDGVLQQVPTPISLLDVKKVVSFLKVLADLDIAEGRRDQDGRIAGVYQDPEGETRQIDMRLSVLPGPHGSDVVLRILDTARIRIPLADLGLAGSQYDQFHDLIRSPGGLILVAGPTASGKTTTLYACLHEINTNANKILSVEDPIEYMIPKTNQKQVSAAMSFADYARAFMRQNPDILMIGEVRDEETARIALRAAQMGHLVLTTLHARDALTALSRLAVLSEDRSLVAQAVIGVLSQRLLRRVCRECNETCPVPPDVSALLPGQLECGNVRGTGCDACRGTGYHGQIGVFELLGVGQEERVAIGSSGAFQDSLRGRFRGMYEHALDHVKNGVTSVEEVLRTVPNPS